MEKVVNEDLNNYRYERKFVVSAIYHREVVLYLRLHPALFTEIFNQRFVNNIYLDTIALKNYHENVNGDSSRVKYRIRWYGDFYGRSLEPKLEIKIKQGSLGRKEVYPLESFDVCQKISAKSLLNIFQASNLPRKLLLQLKMLKPVITNRYSRKYYESYDQHYRITLDTNMSYNRFHQLQNQFLAISQDFKNIIMEMKYNFNDEITARNITKFLPGRVDKNSKYVNAIERTYI
jgi:SPX domain protein involved in polyphosphate accumulation